MNWKFTTEPDAEPVTLEEAKEHLRILHDDDDAYITALIVVSRETLEAKMWRPICTRTVKLYMNNFSNSSIVLPQSANCELVSITYKDSTGANTTLTDAQLDNVAEPAILYPPVNGSFPVTNGAINNVVIEYTAGYDVADMPKSIKQACLLIIGHLYQNREEVVVGRIASEIPQAADFLTSNYSLKRY